MANFALLTGNTISDSGINSSGLLINNGTNGYIPYTTTSGLSNSNITYSGSLIDISGNLSVGNGTILNYTFVTPDFSTAITQGYTFDGTNHYFMGTNYISKRDASFNVILDNTNPLSGITGVDHLGDGVYLGGFLYCPVESYPAVTGMRIAKYDATTLALVTTYSISAQTHEASSIATDGSFLYISSYDDGTKIWKYSLTGVFISATTMATPFTNNVQGISYYNGKLYVVEQSKYGSVNIDGTGYQFIGNLPGTAGHRGEGIQVVNGISRVIVINDAVSAGNLYYFDNTTSGPKSFSVDATGRLAIGAGATATTNTTTKLELVGSSPTDQLVLLQNTNAAATSSMAFKNNDGTRFLTVGIANSANGLGVSYGIPGEAFLRTSSSTNGLSFNIVGGPLRFTQSSLGTEAMRIANITGNVGIGTTAPLVKFHVLNSGGSISAMFGAGLAAPNYVVIGTTAGGAIPFLQGNDSTVSIFKPISLNPNNGNVLIGTTVDNGVDKLQVNGGARMNGNVTISAVTGQTLVGIGTTNPRNITGFTNITMEGISGATLHFRSSGSTDLGGVACDNSGVGLRSLQPTLPLTFQVNMIEQMRISTSGNTLIGSLFESGNNEKLQVTGNARISGNLFVNAITGTSLVGIGTINPRNVGGFSNITLENPIGGSIHFRGSGSTELGGIYGSDASGIVVRTTDTTHHISLAINDLTKFRVTNSGNTLINTVVDNGLNALQVNGSGLFSTNIRSAGGITNAAPSNLTLSQFDANTSDIASFGPNTSTKGILRFTLYTSNGVPTEVMRLNTNNNILIGTTADTVTDKLQVAGSINSANHIINGNSAGTNTYLLLKNNGVSTALIGNDGALFGGSTADTGTFIYNAGEYFIATGGAKRFTIKSNGNILINKTVDNGDRLQVTGNANITGSLSATSSITSSADITAAAGSIIANNSLFANNGSVIVNQAVFAQTGLVYGKGYDITGNIDMNDTVDAGFYKIDSTTINLPFLSGNYEVQIEAFSTTELTQTATHTATNRKFTRNLFSGVWSSWRELITSVPYTKYVAIMSQAGTVFSNSNVIVLDNTIGAITWSYVSVGQYLGTLSSAFTANKVVAFSNTGAGTTGFMQMFRIDNNTFKINTKDSTNVAANGIMTEASIEIRVYS